MKKIPQIRAGLITCLLFCFYMATGQTKTVTGHVTDSAQNGLPNVTVKVKNQSGGTTTDASGNFSINVPASNAVLVFNYVGMKAQEVTVGDQSSINVILLPDKKFNSIDWILCRRRRIVISNGNCGRRL